MGEQTQLCECANWCRAHGATYPGLRSSDGIPLEPNHHPNCTHYNDSLIDVWKVTYGKQSCYVATEAEASEYVCDEEGRVDTVITQEKMHREVLDNLSEFQGF